MSESDGFLMVSEDALAAVGRVAVGGGFLEGRAHEMLLALGGRPEGKTCNSVLKELRRRAAANGLPDYVSVDPASVTDWCERASRTMEERNSVLHATYYRVRNDGGWNVHAEHLKSGTRRNLTDAAQGADLERIAGDLQTLVKESMHLHRDMLREVRDRVYLKPRRHDGDSWIVIFYGNDPDVMRPSEAEMDEWWATYGPF